MGIRLAPTPAAVAAARTVAERSGRARHAVALVLGSGWSPVVAAVADPDGSVTLPVAGLEGFAAPAAAGHAGTVTSCLVAGHPVLVFAGRSHLYEGVAPAQVVHPVHVAAASGCAAVVLTNAAGGLRADLSVGDLVLLSDHLNLTGRSPLLGAHFVDLVDAYSPALRSAVTAALSPVLDAPVAQGVYAAMPGPQYETPAEIRMLRTLGADLVGMSTVPETIAARALGLQVLGMSLVTNLAAGVTGQALDHAEVLAAGRNGSDRLAEALRASLPAVAGTARRTGVETEVDH